MNIKSRKVRWIVVSLVALFIAVGFAAFKSNQREYEQQVLALGGMVGRKQVLPKQVYLYLPTQLRRFLPKGSIETMGFHPESPVTDADLDPLLSCFQDLVHLELSHTRITDEIMENVSTLPKLRALHLTGTGITDEGIQLLSTSRSLTNLSLSGTKISDESIRHLSKMSQLIWLSLAKTPVTDESIEILLQMPKLRYLEISGTQISEEGKKRLTKFRRTHRW